MDQSEGGLGGVTNDRLATSEANLIERAVRHGWPLNDRIKRLAVNRIVGIIDKSKSNREVIAATRALAEFNKQNIAIDQPGQTHVNVGVQVNQITAQETASEEEIDRYFQDEVELAVATRQEAADCSEDAGSPTVLLPPSSVAKTA